MLIMIKFVSFRISAFLSFETRPESSASWVALVTGSISTLKVSFTAQVSIMWLVRQSLCCRSLCKAWGDKCCREPPVWPTLCPAGSILVLLCLLQSLSIDDLSPTYLCCSSSPATPLCRRVSSAKPLKCKGVNGDVDTRYMCSCYSRVCEELGTCWN